MEQMGSMRHKEILQQAIFQTIGDVSRWQEELRLLIKATGATKGIIALRDRQTAELVIPEDVRHDLSSPFLCGFSVSEVEDYVGHYYQFDPWTKFEKLHHPNQPFALSRYVDLNSLKSSPFWAWLEPQNISDTVVLDIGKFHPNWIAMNLYFSEEDENTRKKIIRLTTDLQQAMQDAWRYIQQHRASQLEPERLQYFLEQQTQAAMLLSSRGSIILINKKASKQLKKNNTHLSIDNNQLHIRNKLLRSEFDQAMQQLKVSYSIDKIVETRIQICDLILTLTLIEKAEDQLGFDKGMRLLTIQSQAETTMSSSHPIWENPILTKRERQLVELLASGGRVVDFIKKYYLSKATGYFHWQNVKKKLKVKDRSSIYAQHQIYLKNLENL